MVAALRDEDLQPVMLNSITLSGAAIQSFPNPLTKMHCYRSKWIANANKKIIRIRGFRIKMFYFLLLHHLYQLLQKCKADNTCLLITIVNCSLRKAACSAGKNDTC
jgi:hypothetical protein